MVDQGEAAQTGRCHDGIFVPGVHGAVHKDDETDEVIDERHVVGFRSTADGDQQLEPRQYHHDEANELLQRDDMAFAFAVFFAFVPALVVLGRVSHGGLLNEYYAFSNLLNCLLKVKPWLW